MNKSNRTSTRNNYLFEKEGAQEEGGCALCELFSVKERSQERVIQTNSGLGIWETVYE
ncbi:hypothetical protein ACM26V_19130 [Salipaludibacillus sp. HK11]|uniref:hypothetical protein n=1 Tax=Salipaludibacillus sp. HK11 TaxID=3394320 RepID=UPI0039FC0D11